jgi:ketosteroid isomerase-like protein
MRGTGIKGDASTLVPVPPPAIQPGASIMPPLPPVSPCLCRSGLLRLAFAIVAWCTLCLAMSACSRPSDEQELRTALDEMQSAMEAGQPRQFMDHVAEDFTGDEGTLDRASLHNLLRAQVLANARIGISLASVEVELHGGDRATVLATVTLAGGNGRWLPERGSVYRITSGWRKAGGDWQCINAQWDRAL